MKNNFTTCIYGFLFSLLFILPTTATQAHSPDQTYLFLRIYKNAFGGRMELNVKDLNKALNLNLNSSLTEAEFAPYYEQVKAYITSNMSFSAGQNEYGFRITGFEIFPVDEMKDDFVILYFEADDISEVPDGLDINYEVFFASDSRQRGMLIIEYNWKAGVVENHTLVRHVFSPNDREEQISLVDMSIWKGVLAMIKLGIWHIWIGLDHILFILALILPAVVRRRDLLSDKDTVITDVSSNYSNTWLPVARFKPAFWYIIKIITFFTVAHSITLAAAALGLIDLPSRFVESVIALSIALAALHNITPIFKHKEWMIAFGFGLFHGFGFASVLGDKGLGGDYMVLSLFGFNVGVELGQVLIICMIFPFLFLMRRLTLYPRIVSWGSVALILISMYWTIERGFNVDLPAGKYFWNSYSAIAQLFG